MRFDESFDVVVAGFGLAGGIAAITVAEASIQTGDRGRTERIPALPRA